MRHQPDEHPDEALVTEDGSDAIDARIHTMGLNDTSIFKGCPQPSGRPCSEDEAAKSTIEKCSDWKKSRTAAFQLFLSEPFRIAIRKAVATWPGA